VQLRLADDGEVLLKAPQLMRGYHRSAEPAFDGQGWFHTGDLALQHEGGLFEIVGRSRDLIISGGENIHPAEIENLVSAMPAVADCAVVGLPDSRWGEVPVLAVVLRPGQRLDIAELDRLLERSLARFKRPRRVVQLPLLPRTALGKVKRSELVRQMQDSGGT
jgi:fatty-acyl-CoA synthase